VKEKGVEFPMFEKLDVNGVDTTHDVYAYLRSHAPEP
jgi:glutathione peroxidase-family protein